MPDSRKHRGAHPEDVRLFNTITLSRLRQAVADFSWLLTRGYGTKSGIQLVGDRYRLQDRQRQAVLRSACSDQDLQRRGQHRLPVAAVRQQPIHVDGYNLLTTVESALSGAVLLRGRDGSIRDLASVHGNYRKVEETVPAIEQIARWGQVNETGHWTWYLDRPVSNSGRLKGIILEVAKAENCDWAVELVYSPDAVLSDSQAIVITSDSQILNRACTWVNAAFDLLSPRLAEYWLLDLGRKTH